VIYPTNDAVRQLALELTSSLIRRYNLTFLAVPLERLFPEFHVRRVQLVGGVAWSGLLRNVGNGYAILLNGADPRSRRRFSCAHELAQLIVARAAKPSLDTRDD
jgi:hypothetical protein